MSTIAEYGTWKTGVITPDMFSKCNCKSICESQVAGDTIFWTEQNATTGKRELFSKNHRLETSTPQRWAVGKSVQTSLHEYGGGALHVSTSGIIFATNDGLYKQSAPDGDIELIVDTKDGKDRFGDCSSTATHIFAVNENHESGEKYPENRLVAIDRQTRQVTVVASGADFYAYPRVSPNGDKLVWMEWNHPNMPWDETSIRVANLDTNGKTTNEQVLRSGEGKQINYMEPSWISNDKLLMINDSTNWWNVYEVDLENSQNERNVLPIQQEIGYPLWQLGFESYAKSDQFLALNVNNEIHVVRNDGTTFHVSTPDYTVFSHLSIDDDELFAIAAGPKRASSLISINLTTKSIRVHRESRDAADIDRLEISLPETITFESDGVKVEGYFYPPTNSAYRAADASSAPPVLLMGHSGPTAPAQTSLDLKKQFFTSRGIAVFDVNYRGSTGFGSEFRRMLYKNLGIVDRNDILNGARALIEQGKVDADKIIITGSSAGGFLILSCLISPDNLIKGATSLYGVADLSSLDEDTHKFEKCYNELLVGKMPEAAQIYEQRSPLNHLAKIQTPIAFLHGKEDTVVPMQQSIEMFEKLRAQGVMTALELYDGEGHGFRSGRVIQQSTESVYYFLMRSIGIDPGYEASIEIVNQKDV